MQELVIIGGSNAFWEISELVKDINSVKKMYKIVGILDDNETLWGKKFEELYVDGPIEKVHTYGDKVKFVLAIGSFRTRIIRSQIIKKLDLLEERYVTLIHPTAKVFSTSEVKNGCIIHYGSVIFNHTTIESYSVISANCVVGVGNLIGKGALLGSTITTTTGVRIGSFSFVGSSSSIGEGIEIGPGAQVGMGSLVLKNIKAGCFVLGNPLRVLDKIKVPENIIEEWEKIKINTIKNL
jgi:acetyltransferase EpsM